MLFIEFLQKVFGDRFLGFFLGVTHLGGEAIYILLLSLYYWLLDPRQGRLLTLILTLSVISNIVLKNAFALPRPYVVNPAVITQKRFIRRVVLVFPAAMPRGSRHFGGDRLVTSKDLAVVSGDHHYYFGLSVALVFGGSFSGGCGRGNTLGDFLD